MKYRPNASTVCNESCRKEGGEIRTKFKSRLVEIDKKRLTVLMERKAALKAKQIKNTLLQSKEKGEESLREIKTVLEKKKAFTVQLNFRKFVLKQEASDKNLYALSRGRKQKSVNELIQQVSTLIEESRAAVTKEKKLRSGSPLLVNKRVRHKFSDGNIYIGKVLLIVPGFDFISTEKLWGGDY
ncbi:hypothetical protein KUTeg_020340 [Tegillarca granosa]|uniref:Uncharacterized protein n=1 Tax=Tegillarca granosa TaxID=220873 RepID=A0ABQ9E7K2_TEGGR|nr:hypothetical protein KUTeg_020340 [Tegillarca granosa]